MKRISLILAAVLVLEAAASLVCDLHSPAEYAAFSDIIRVVNLAVIALMFWGGAEACVWLVRKSPLAGWTKIYGDWNMLWVFLGVSGAVWNIAGAFLCLGAGVFGINTFGSVYGEQFFLGTFIWLAAGVFFVPAVWVRCNEKRVREILIAGLGLQLLCLPVYVYVYPAPFEPLSVYSLARLVIGIASSCHCIFGYVLGASAVWGLLLKTGWPAASEEDRLLN